MPYDPLKLPNYSQIVSEWLKDTPCSITRLAKQAKVTRSRLSDLVNHNTNMRLSTIGRILKAMRQIQGTG